MRRIDLNLLVVFDAIMREGSMTRAAQALAMTQPAVSNAVARMRSAWNDPVFVKKGRGIEPTPRARIIWRRVGHNLEELRQLASPGPFDAGQAQRTFRFGAADFNLGLLWRRLRQHVEQQAPGINLYAVPISKAETMSLLLDAEVDVSIAPVDASNHKQIHSEPLLDSHFVCAMRPDHPLAGRMRDLDSYAAADHLLVSLSGDPTGLVDEYLQEHGLTRRVAMTVNHFSPVAQLLKDTRLICTVPYEVVAEEVEEGSLWICPPPLDIPPIKLALLWHERTQHDAGHRWLRELIRSLVCDWKQMLVPQSATETAASSAQEQPANLRVVE